MRRNGIHQIEKDFDNEELRYSIRSILQNIPWVRKIYILIPNEKVRYFIDNELIREKIVYFRDKDLLGYDSSNSLSFQLGTSVAQYLMQYGEKELNYEEFKAGIELVMNMSAKAKEEGEKFLAENAKREGVKTTASGLQYEVLESTIGQKPKATDNVRVHYEGTLIDGTVFDSSYKRGESIAFPLNGVIKGWTEGLQLMSVGSKYKFFIPYQLAYGEHGAGASIPPYAALIFTVELLGIE